MNPYDFVRIDWSKGVNRHSGVPHDRFVGFSGRLEGTITALTPVFIPESEAGRLRFRRDKPFLVNGNGDPIIPGSSLKGLIRNLVETVGYGCWWLFKGDHAQRLPYPFKQCQRLQSLCVACRMFGMVQGDTHLKGHVGFEDAVCTDPVDHDSLYTIILSTPKPRHTAFYLAGNGNPAGRKFYFHHSTPPDDMGGWRPKGRSAHEAQNQYITPLGPGSVFTFSAHFDNLQGDELALLLYTLVLEPEMRHKLGYGKPAGLGSVEFELNRLELIDYRKRYTAPDRSREVYEDKDLDNFVANRIAPYVNDRSSVTLQDLRRIWQWPGRDDIQYPHWSWFQNNPRTPISQTP
jgi:CRISPR/Cas system CSM-associated protein Csm3 (group 7 of RAMP superfamily)